MTKYHLTPQASDDLFEVWKFIAQNSLEAANRVEEAVYLACNFLVASPLAGGVRVDLTPLPVRFWLVQPYGNLFIVYDPEKKPLQIIRILHASRDLPSILR